MRQTQAEQAQHFERTLIRHGACTLARIKPASLFNYHPPAGHLPKDCFEHFDALLADKGLRLVLLRADQNKQSCLILLVDEDATSELLRRPCIVRFFAKLGYPTHSLDALLAEIAHRLKGSQEALSVFPHELGVILGYPLNDVCAFMRRKKPCLCAGFWKAYHKPQQAQDVWKRYRSCIDFALKAYEVGLGPCDLEQAWQRVEKTTKPLPRDRSVA